MSSSRKSSGLNRATYRPVAPASRIVEVDIVRGFALFGVLLVNMYGFGADSMAWNSPTDQLAFAIMRVFFESKSWTLFSMLFGFGFAVQLQRVHERGFNILPIYLRRLAVLFALGAAHALLYDGDILMLYAELGLGLLVVRRLPTRRLLLLAVGLMLVFPLARFVSTQDQPAGLEEIQSVGEARAQLERAQRNDVYATGSLAEVAADNASAIPADPLEDVTSPESGLAVFAMFLLGFSVGRSGVLRDIPGHTVSIARVRAWGLGFGLAAMAAERVLAATAGYAVFRSQQAGPGVQFAGDLLFAFGIAALALGYAATLILAAQTPRGKAALAPLAAGRPPGPDRLPDPDPDVYHLVLRVRLRPGLSTRARCRHRLGSDDIRRAGRRVSWWSRRFRFGPMEWLWRCLTYLKWQPLRLRSDSKR